MKVKKRLVILDTHAILHRAYHALPDFVSSKGEPTGALYGLVSMLVKIISDFKPDYIVAAFDLPGDTHRHVAYKEYKAHRAPTDDALVSQLKRSREVLDALGVARYECEGFEADDVIGTIAQEMKQHGGVDVIIASGDMDMLQLVDDDRVRVFTFKKGLADTILYNEAAIVERFGFGPLSIPDLKGIMGDASDNIKGVKGVGEGSALKLIKTFGTIEAVYRALKTKGVETVAAEAGVQKRFAQLMLENEEDAVFSKMLAEIRRDAPIQFALPEKEWMQSVSPQKVLDMMAEFDFRSLLPRLKKLLEPDLFGDAGEFTLEVEAEPVAHVSPEDLGPVALALWVLDSNITQPTLDDIYRVGKSADFVESKEAILKEVKARGLDFIYNNIELPLAPVLRGMEAVGIQVDNVFLKKLSNEYGAELKKIAARIFDAAGEEFNINSPKQLGDVLFDKLGLVVKNQKKTAGGQRSTKESELEKMRTLHPVVGDILAHRELQKLLSTYIDTIPTLLDQQGRLHTSYVQTGTTTGRLSSQNPNLQNIPIKTELGRAIRHAFVAGEGMQLLSFDYSQIELRIAAFLSGDKVLIDIFKNGRDVHTEVAMRVFHIEAKDVTYEQRRRAKVINFGILYGMGVNALKDSLGTERKDAQEFYNQYFEAFPRLAAYLEETKADAARLGYTTTYFGRRRYFDGIKSPVPYIRASAERMAINAPVQGTAADIIKLAMVAIGEWIEKENLQESTHLLLQVHDELVFEVETRVLDTVAPRIKHIMENTLSAEKRHHIPFSVEGKQGTNWGDMQAI
jgi:DNA polymerase-1